MSSVIAIVGRPNVGKSTLFNRLTRSRDALVADRPGVTRDRQYGIAEYDGTTFMLVDTGGLGDSEGIDKNIFKKVSQQARNAIEEADAVLWLVDGKTGLLSTDEQLAGELRSISKNLFLVVNKTDGVDVHIACADFFKLGIENPIPISAERGEGISDLMEMVISSLPLSDTLIDPDIKGLRVTVIGRPNVGKSTLVNRMLGEERMLTFDHPGTTRDSVQIPFQRMGRDYVLIDTAGLRRKARVTDAVEKFSAIKSLQAIDKAEIIILVIDAQEALTEQDLSLLGLTVDSGKSLIIAVNKWDGLETDQKILIKNQLDRKLGFVDYACIHFISALHGTGVGKLFDTINKIGKSQAAKFSSSLVSELLADAVAQHQPPLVRGRRIKLRYAHLGGHNPLRIIIHGNQTREVPATYRRYLENTFRKKLQLIGTPILIEFKHSDNPYKHKRNVLTRRQTEKRRRLMRHVKKRK